MHKITRHMIRICHIYEYCTSNNNAIIKFRKSLQFSSIILYQPIYQPQIDTCYNAIQFKIKLNSIYPKHNKVYTRSIATNS